MGMDTGAPTNTLMKYDYIPIFLVSLILILYITDRFMKPRRSLLRHPLRPFWAKLRRLGYIIGASHKNRQKLLTPLSSWLDTAKDIRI